MSDSKIDVVTAAPLKPSDFMRKRRPELYSDTVDRPLYLLDRSALEFQLETVTSRNEHQRFEIFCRKLCERAVCPQIRPQSGPEGGGDGKTDADTIPVAAAISDRNYVGHPGPGREIWAFAFSAMKDWKRKVARDVAGIAGTGRAYERIYFVTNQPARSKDRARLESEFASAHGMPVHILDRAWIVNEVIDNERKDIAHDYLGVGQIVTDPLRLGPEDYSRRRRLDDVERSLADPRNYDGMERQLVTEAMIAALLSRNLELPRHETDGRHARAIRLAERHGTERQRLEAQHDSLWTAFWWFDDAGTVSTGYGDIEKEALNADHARNLEFLVQLHQLLGNAVIYRMLTRDAAEFEERSDRLEAALERMTESVDRPNHRLEARTSLVVVRLGRDLAEGRKDRLAEIWRELGSILDDAEGLAEYDADRLVRLIEVASMPAGRDPTYRAVAERLADFVAKRYSESEGALILLHQALQLGVDERFESIRLLGRASLRLAKREHATQLIEAQQHLAIAYRGADLLWAARASCLFAAAGLAAEGEEESQLPAGFVPTVKTWAWIALQLRLVPELLLAMRLLNMSLVTLPLDDDSKVRVAESSQELDAAFGSNILNMTDAELASISNLPDALAASGMAASRTALLYALGYEDLLREEGEIPEQAPSGSVANFMALLKAQPVSSEIYGPLILNRREDHLVETCISGLTIEVRGAGHDNGIVVAQSIMGTFEAVLATIVEEQVGAHTERFCIDIVETDGKHPKLDTDLMAMRAIVSWPRSLSPQAFDRQNEIGRFLMQVVGEVLAATFVLPDTRDTLERLFARGNAHDRVSILLASLASIHRITGKHVVRLDDGLRDYPLRARRSLPDIEPPPSGASRNSPHVRKAPSEGPPQIGRHRAIKVQSVIDIHSWDQARWNSTLYASYGSDFPPVLALGFRDDAAARQIFKRWRERFGPKDVKHEIHLSIIRGLPGHPPSHYAVQITSSPSKGDGWNRDALYQTVNRILVMEPSDNRHLERFLAQRSTFGCYLLAPAVVQGKEPEILTDLAILKRDVSIVQARDVEPHDIEHVAVEMVLRRGSE